MKERVYQTIEYITKSGIRMVKIMTSKGVKYRKCQK